VNTLSADRQSIRVRCLELALQGQLSSVSSMSGAPSTETVLAKAKAFEAYIFGEQR
jgi:hypothetical protein